MSVVDSNIVQVGASATALNNLVISTDGAGNATIEQGVIGGGSNRVVMTIDGNGVTSFPTGVSIADGKTPTSVALPITIGNTNYTNNSGRAKMISFSAFGSAATSLITLTVGGVVVGTVPVASGVNGYGTLSYILPDGVTANFAIATANLTSAYYTHMDL